MAGYDGHRGWINYLGVLPDHRRCGYGQRLVAAAESYLTDIGCPKVNLQIRRSNQEVIDFYRRLGYNTDEVVSMGKRLVVDRLQDQGKSRPGQAPAPAIQSREPVSLVFADYLT